MNNVFYRIKNSKGQYWNACEKFFDDICDAHSNRRRGFIEQHLRDAKLFDRTAYIAKVTVTKKRKWPSARAEKYLRDVMKWDVAIQNQRHLAESENGFRYVLTAFCEDRILGLDQVEKAVAEVLGTKPEKKLKPRKIGRNLSTPESRAFWAGVDLSARALKDQPAWVRAGIDINPDHFETYESDSKPRKP